MEIRQLWLVAAGFTQSGKLEILIAMVNSYKEKLHLSEVLNRKRPLSLNMIRKLQSGLGIPADVLIQPYEVEKVEA